MGWSDTDGLLTRLLSGSPTGIILSFLITIALPTLLHYYFYATSPRTAITPTFLLLGPSGSGKTSLVSLLQQRVVEAEGAESSPTRTSQEHSVAQLFLPTSVPLGSNKYRSENDHELQDAAKNPARYIMIDTPGHGKLRSEQALSQLSNPAVRGVVYMVDSTALESSSSETARDVISYLYDLLLALQRRKTGTTKAKTDIPVLIAANKQDLFTALPTGAIKDRLQKELEKVRRAKTRSITTVDQDPDAEDEDAILGGGGEESFSFNLLEEGYGITVEMIGGAVRGEEAGKGVRKWEEWIGSCL